jgi:hypothetical protein
MNKLECLSLPGVYQGQEQLALHRLGRKWLSGSNAVAYSAMAVEKNSFKTPTPALPKRRTTTCRRRRRRWPRRVSSPRTRKNQKRKK